MKKFRFFKDMLQKKERERKEDQSQTDIKHKVRLNILLTMEQRKTITLIVWMLVTPCYFY